MKAIINGKAYDTDEASWQATFLTASDTDHQLYRTADGEFFLVLDEVILDGRRLGPLEDVKDLAPELVMPDTPSPAAARIFWERQSRINRQIDIVPVTAREALLWSIKTQIPATLRGYVLDCV